MAGYQYAVFVIMLCANTFQGVSYADNSAARTTSSCKCFRVTKPAACSDTTRIDSSLASSGETRINVGGPPGRHVPLSHPGTDARVDLPGSCVSLLPGIDAVIAYLGQADLREASRIGHIRSGIIGFGWDLHPKSVERAV